jgi:SAM-dependent methyltransferase
MKNAESWQPTKFELHAGQWRASRDPAQVGRGSRLIGDLLGEVYYRLIKEHATGHLIDIGCGKTPLYGAYRSLVTEVTCVDWPQSFHQQPYVDQQFDLNEPWPLTSNTYQTALSTDVLEHLPNPGLFWSEAARILQPGGKLILGVPFLYWIHEAPHDYHRFTEHALRRYAEQAGLRTGLVEPYGSAVHVLLDISAKLVSRRGWLSRLHEMLSKVMLHIPPVPHWIGNTSRNFPLGYAMVCEKPDHA